MSESVIGSKKGWIVTLSGTGINLALGVLYTWSVISKKIPASWGWDEADKALPYTIACLVFAFMMIPAGRLQDKLTPRLVATIGGVLIGAGLIVASFFTSVLMFIVAFGVIAGTGIGFGYAAATPAAVKWFPPAKTGMIAGIVVAGFGLAPVYISPLAEHMINANGVANTLLILGGVYLVVVVVLAQFLVNPPIVAPAAGAKSTSANDFSIKDVLSTPQFYFLWLMYAFNAGAGLMVIGKLAIVVQQQADYKGGFILVALMAIGNAGGRLIAGSFSDKLGRIRTMQVFTALQMLLMFAMPFMDSVALLVPAAILIGACYGSNLALFPSITKDFFGLKNFGVNYGLVFTAWGVGSILAVVSGIIQKRTGSFDKAFYLSGALLAISIGITFLIKKPVKKSLEAEA
jgi:OFA family oxalate/formate antiporter-like MFS transporter